ncbi:MAG: hypothetical protein KBC84_11530 [Proteobacteria bacterium]|nr:hypothetical protein [Pseudomonadota bacterium]
MFKFALIYFGLVFGSGFFLGTIRVLFLLPLLGLRTAELAEAPLMLVAIYFSARLLVRKYYKQQDKFQLIGVGLSAVGMVLVGDVIVGMLVFNKSPLEIFTDRDLVSGSVYYILLLIYALMPWVLEKQQKKGIVED